MRIADWLTYIDIEQLKQMSHYYNCEIHDNSKHNMIRSLLQQINARAHMERAWEELSDAERRFFTLLIFDSCPAFTMEELLAKGRIAFDGQEGQPRSLVVLALKKGWLFRGYSLKTQNLYHIPSDVRDSITEHLRTIHRLPAPHIAFSAENEECLLARDMVRFLRYLNREIVRLTSDGAIYRQNLKQILQSFHVDTEDHTTPVGPRFGFGRRYHLYPDRFSLLYDYAFYKEYIVEEDSYLILSDVGQGKLHSSMEDEARDLYRFWIRLYRRPLPNLPVIVKWIGLLANEWVSSEVIYEQVKQWIAPYYYETVESLYQRVIKMLLHLGAISQAIHENETFIRLTKSGSRWIDGVTVFQEREVSERFLRVFDSR